MLLLSSPTSTFALCLLALNICAAAPPIGGGEVTNKDELPIEVGPAPIYEPTKSVLELQNLKVEPFRKEELLSVRVPVVDLANDSFTEEKAEVFMREINEESMKRSNAEAIISWNYYSNITDANKKIMVKSMNEAAQYSKDRWNRIQQWKDAWPKFSNENLKRQFKFYSVLGTAALPKEKFERYTFITTEMEEIYGMGKICDYRDSSKCDLSLEPEIEDIIKTSRDYDELLHVWKEWRDAVGRPIKQYYPEYVELSNEAAALNGFNSVADMWTYDYESKTFEDDVLKMYNQLKPLYFQLFSYTRRKLREVYGESRISKRGPIPAHLTGNMWAQTWSNIFDILEPYPNKASISVSEAMKEQGYTPLLMFQKADDFFASMGLERVPPSFWNNSIIEKPEGVELVCHASAWDFSDGKDFRIKQCTKVAMEDFGVVHHELGHIQYYMQYKDLPFVFRSGANPGFHEAVGDVLSLSVMTPKHLAKVGLLQNLETDDEADINFLMRMALDKVAFLPFGYLIDRYRWEIMHGHVGPENYSSSWWGHRFDLQGIISPVEWTEEDFDAAGKYHVAANVRYIRYFVANILQFQFYKSACILANEYDPNDPLKPLHRCDIFESKEAGKALGDMLKLGSSVHWSEPLQILTGSKEMSAEALREYFAPLEKWLIADNEKHGEYIGWAFDYLSTWDQSDNSSATETPSPNEELPEESNQTEVEAAKFIKEIDDESSAWHNNVTIKAWNFQTNITASNKKEMVESRNAYGEYSKTRWNKIQEWKDVWPTFTDESLKRQFKLYSVIGISALPKEKFEMFTNVTTEMKSSYSTGKICDYNNSTKCDLSLEPDLKNILKKNRDYDELLHVWKSWRDAVGKPVRNLFSKLVELSNEAAIMNGFSSNADMWTHDYESDTFEQDVADMYEQLKPLYRQLHAYTRRKLREIYGESRVSKRGLIPAHITGNMWAQTFENLFDILVPYPNETALDVTETMVEQGFTPLSMFQKADDFFASLNLERVPESFWNKSVIEKRPGLEMVCHASAWDFSDGKDFRIKQCTSVDMDDFATVHHELGHIQYFMQYKHLPYSFRSGANPGFHEALGDVLSLSVSTPKHLKKVGLLDKNEINEKADINFLLKRALTNVAFLPFGYMIDKYRWDVFRGEITPDNYTSAWWQYRHDLQGIKAPITRTEEDFDPSAKFHVSANSRYMRYFVSSILQFQFHKAACQLANEYDPNDPLKPLHRCDIYQSAEAGEALKKMLQVGASVHWSQPLKAFTGSEKMDASALTEYFRPLEKWLIADNEKHGEFVGWEEETEEETVHTLTLT